ncbi:MAG: thermonuclease family protein [Deltaproteobacteria bacterium]|nr:thermonuclease family protein [Deltaproteobacteria bacterium]
MKEKKINQFLVLALLLLFAISLNFPSQTFSAEASSSKEEGDEPLLFRLPVKKIIDGDTIVLDGGRVIRYVGIDTPEYGEAFFWEATNKNKSHLKETEVLVVVCSEEPFDRFGRTLGWVSANGVDIGAELLRAGLAKTLMIPPCGREKSKEYKALEEEAKKNRIGIWSQK